MSERKLSSVVRGPLDAVPTSVTVCVVVLDRVAAMRRCLDAVLRLTAPEGVRVDVVVVDNGSTDGTWELLQARAAELPQLTALAVTGPVGKARNAAVAAATGDVVAFTDSDCEPEAGWLVAGLRPFADPRVAVVQGRTVPAGPLDERWSVSQDIGSRSGLFEACNVFYRRPTLLEVGGFGEQIGFFGEDTLAGWRVLRTGASDVFAADAVVRHDVTHPGFAWHLRRARYYTHWPELLRELPELREELLWHRWFLRRRSAEAALALGGLVLAVVTRRPAAALAAAPLAWRHRPRGLSRQAVEDAAGALVFDLAVEAALVEGSARTGTVVL